MQGLDEILFNDKNDDFYEVILKRVFDKIFSINNIKLLLKIVKIILV